MHVLTRRWAGGGDPRGLWRRDRPYHRTGRDGIPPPRHRREGRGYEFERYFLNRWTSSPVRWLPAGAWDGSRSRGGSSSWHEVALGFDGSYNQDSTGLVGVTLEGEPHVFVVGCWERPDHSPDWVVPRTRCNRRGTYALEHYQVAALVCDPPVGIGRSRNGQRRTGRPSSSFETNRRNVMSTACDRFYGQVVNKRLSHDGDAPHSPAPRQRDREGDAAGRDYHEGQAGQPPEDRPCDRRGARRRGARLEPEDLVPLFALGPSIF